MIARVPGPVGPPPVASTVAVEFDQCRHAAWKHARRTQSNGVVVVVRQCDDCGANMGAVPKAGRDLTALPAFDDAKRADWLKARREDWSERYAAAREERDQEWRDWYDAYLQSPEWRAKRQWVLTRDRGICQGCLQATATQVHHTDYRRVGRELLIDLTSLCDTCHAAAHPDKDRR